VWDDIDLKIKAATDLPEVRAAAAQEVKATQKGLENPTHALEILPLVLKSWSCLNYMDEAYGLNGALDPVNVRDMVVTTRAREKAWITFNAHLSGHMIPLAQPDRHACEFL
jgi:hypothetical protein